MSVQERRCPACQTPAAEGQRFCSKCGRSLPEWAAASAPPPPAPEPPAAAPQEPASAPPVAPPPPPPVAPPPVAPPPPPPSDATGPAPVSPLGDGPQSEAGFLACLFDFSFTSFVTTKIIKVLYVLSMIGVGLGYLGFVAAAFNRSSGAGLIVLLVIGPIVSLFYLAWIRVLMEIAIVFFRINESTADIRHVIRGEVARRG